MREKERSAATNIKDELEKSFSEFDRQRADGLESLLAFQASQTAADERNFARLRRKYGANHSLVREAAAKIGTGGIFTADLKREITKTQTTTPEAKADAWTIYGYVFDARNDGVDGADVSFFDEQGEPLPRTEKTKTDKKGFFLLRATNVKNLPASVRIGVSAEFLSDKILAPGLGELDYAEITIAGEVEEDPHCEPAGDPIPTGQNFSDWMVTGKVTDSRGAGISNLRVRVFNRVLNSDDALGVAETDANGVYRLTFTKKQFSDFGENCPELYLIIKDAAGKQIFDGKRESKTKAGRIELIDVRLKEQKNETEKPKRKKR